MRAGPEIAGSTVYARFAGLPASEIRARFARLLHASWSRGSDGGWTLSRSNDDRREVRRIERDLLVAEMERGLRELPVPPSGSPVAAAQAYIAGLERDTRSPITETSIPAFRGPADGLLADLLRALGPKGIADALLAAPFGSPVAFSDVPKPREALLPSAARPALAEYAEVDEAFGRAVGDELAGNLDSWVRERLIEAARKVGVSRVLLILNRPVGLVQAHITTYDATGTMRGRAQVDLDTTRGGSEPNAKELALPDPLPNGDEAAIKAIAVRGVIPSPALLPYKDPFVRDPLEIRALPVLRAVAGDVLVALPDRVARETAKVAMTTPDAFVATLARSGVRLRREDGFTLGEPVNPLDFDRTCVDRAELRRWILEGAGRDLSAVRSLGILYARGGPAVSYGGLFGWYRDLLLPRMEGIIRPDTLYPQLLRTIGTLSDDEWQVLVRGKPVLIGAPALRAESMDEYTRLGPLMLDPVSPERGQTPVADVYRTGTAAFPKGLPPGTHLLLESREEPAFWNPKLKLWTNLGNYLSLFLSWGSFPAEITDATLANAVGQWRFDEAKRTFFTFRVDFGAPVETTQEMDEEAVRDVRRGLSYSELSEEARAAIRTEVKSVREAFSKKAVKKP